MSTAVKWLLAVVALTIAVLPPRPPAPGVPTVAADGSRTLGRASLRREAEWVTLQVMGTPYEMGYQQGSLLAPEIRGLLTTNLAPLLAETGLDPLVIRRYARGLFRGLPAPLQDELQGVADGASVGLTDVLLWNIAPTLRTLSADLPALLASAPAPAFDTALVRWRARTVPPGTMLPWGGVPLPLAAWPALVPAPQEGVAGGDHGFAAWGEATAADMVLVGAMLQAGQVHGRPLLVARRPAHGLPSLSVALPGEVGARAGVNAAGVVLLLLPSPSIDQAAHGIIPPLLLASTLASADTAEQALRVVAGARRSEGAMWLVADGEQAVAVASSARQFQVLSPEANSWFVVAEAEGQPAHRHTQHWFAANTGWVTPENLLAFLSDPIPGRDTDPAGGRGTWVGLVAVPATGGLWLTQPAGGLPAPAAGFTTFRLPELLAEGGAE